MRGGGERSEEESKVDIKLSFVREFHFDKFSTNQNALKLNTKISEAYASLVLFTEISIIYCNAEWKKQVRRLENFEIMKTNIN